MAEFNPMRGQDEAPQLLPPPPTAAQSYQRLLGQPSVSNGGTQRFTGGNRLLNAQADYYNAVNAPAIDQFNSQAAQYMAGMSNPELLKYSATWNYGCEPGTPCHGTRPSGQELPTTPMYVGGLRMGWNPWAVTRDADGRPYSSMMYDNV